MNRHPEREPSGITVKAVDMAAIIAEVAPKIKQEHPEYVSIDTHYPIGVVETPNGYFILDMDGVMDANPITKENPYPLGLYCSKEENSIAIFPTFKLNITDETIKTEFKYIEEVPLEKFIRVFGSRLESNYYILKQELTKYMTFPMPEPVKVKKARKSKVK